MFSQEKYVASTSSHFSQSGFVTSALRQTDKHLNQAQRKKSCASRIIISKNNSLWFSLTPNTTHRGLYSDKNPQLHPFDFGIQSSCLLQAGPRKLWTSRSDFEKALSRLPIPRLRTDDGVPLIHCSPSHTALLCLRPFSHVLLLLFSSSSILSSHFFLCSFMLHWATMTA